MEAFSPLADEPPEEPASEVPPLDAASLGSELEDSLEEPPVLVSPPVVLDLLVEVVEVDVVDRATFSALVSDGGMMLGVLFGTDSDTLPPPQA